MGALTIGILLLTACGRIGFDSGIDGDVGGTIALCEMSTIVPGPVPDPDIDLSLVATDTGFTALWNVTAGGTIDGINLTTTFKPDAVTTASPVTVITLAYKSNAAAFVADTLVCAPTLAPPSPRQTFVKIVNRDLSGYTETALLNGANVTAPFGSVDTMKTLFLVDEGLVSHDLDDAWVPTGTTRTLLGVGGVDGAMIQNGAGVVIAWSSPFECRIAVVSSNASSGTPPIIDGSPCSRPRMVRVGANEFALAFERDRTILFTRGFTSTLDVMDLTVAAIGTSPRLVHDGDRFWFAWLDGGTVRIGYGDDAATAQRDTTIVAATSAFELILADGVPHLIAMTSAGLVRRTFATRCP